MVTYTMLNRKELPLPSMASDSAARCKTIFQKKIVVRFLYVHLLLAF
ncbi:hypothetical protein [Paenibacillus dendritiformis]|nr:hypothetical protein [Paenibacillus dendritiformis]CAH8770785.1 hypothetical protein H7S4_003520 [Paenibacillus dendritiformis]